MITQIVKFNIKEQNIEQFKALLEDDKQGAKAETGLLEMRLYQDKNESGVFFAYERFEDQNAVDYHGAQGYTHALLQVLPEISQSAPEVMLLENTAPAPLHESNPKAINPEDDVFILFFIFKIKPSFKEQLIERFETHVEQTRSQEPGNLVFDLYSIENNNDTLVVYEHWRNESALWDIHFNQPYALETAKLLEQAVIGDMKQYMSFVTEI
ncbi:putative quinol monooxygenase [Pseudoalteromonas carrageenovora]|mgnify:CR=1 FL=1|uniref:putative quinol monooxygenase n=1 Tax=Pseudoalteromonas carrageenovora TaxID=227 RepID=UPI0026E200D7|nr:antibiotic biosynthesis monooxygenase [Pseudoalteromonas carrageenovora]MDO6548807.1 antibiotic biosynthesis monooxygenase [Pseudoalteromonas carrageenovora]MDO6833254.1 antibiotic biosynthesis monooxygenase [Pseudoalteromonas carrageenovora]MDO6837776.1 antibiotic biosynthesis monooxygenase [Pseudoalteromonas carrageenovora]